MSAEERFDNSDHTEESGSNSEDELSGEHVISSTEEYQPPYYEHIEENEYLFDRKKRVNKEVRKMQCDCSYDTDDPGFVGCGENCLNRLLMIECNSRCSCGTQCSNKRFQQGCNVKVEVLKTEKKGWGLRTLEDLEPNQFVMEYCGEVMDYKDFQERAELYDRENRRHYYFMTLRADEIIDATFKGNLSRFINHSCDPNCETQKWTVNGLLRIGFFTQRHITAGTELTFDYKLQRYGKVAQICHCEAPNCRGFIGGEKQTPLKNTVERIATPPTSSPRRRQRKKRNLTADFDDITLEDEVEKLLGDNRGLMHSDQALKLSRLMVRAETTEQRIMLLKILQHTTDQSCLKAFLRFQGLSLLWSWMVDGGGKKAKLQRELLEILRYLPIATKNQLEDSKVIKVVRKWALSLSACPITEAGSSSGHDSHNDSPTDSECTAGADDNDEEKDKNERGSPLFERQCSNKDQSDDDSLDAEVASFNVENAPDGRSMKTKMVAESSGKSPDDLSEDDFKSEDERLPADGVGLMANELLKSWSSLKEVYRIPKKSATPAKQDRILELSVTCSPAGSTDGDHSRTPVEHMCSPGRLETIMKSLRNSPRPIFPVESNIPTASQGFSTSNEDTSVEKVLDGEANQPETADFSSLEFGEDLETKDSPAPDKKEEACSLPSTWDIAEKPHHVKTQSAIQTFGYQQQMNFNMYQGFGSIPQKSNRGKKKKKKWNPQQNNFFQQQDRNVQGSGIYNSNTQPNFGQQQGGTPWRGPSQNIQNVTSNIQGNQFYSGGVNPAPRPQNIGSSNFVGSFPQNGPSFPNFNVPPPNIPPLEFFRKIPPPNFPQQNQPLLIPQLPQNPLVPQQAVPPPPIPGNQPPFFAPNQQAPINRLPPPPPFQPSISTPQTSQFPQSNAIKQQQQLPQGGFPSQQKQLPAFSSPGAQHINIAPTQQLSPPGKLALTMQHQGGKSESFALQTGAVTTSSAETYEPREELEAYTPSPVKHNPVSLPPHWKSATDPQGKVYYYHTQTRRTQWEVPKWDTSPSSEDDHPSNITGLEGTSITSHGYSSTAEVSSPKVKVRKVAKTPTTPPGTPPESPTLAYTTAAADTTAHRRDEHGRGEGPSSGSASHHGKMKEMFRMKLSNVVVNCLNPFFKVDCKSGRILNTEDFKYLARKLTHGILMKELSHLKEEETLHCNDSVKIKTKEYIRTYMKKFGAVYKRT